MRRKLSFRPFLFTWIACWVSWLVLTDNTGPREVVIGAISSSITVAAIISFAIRTHAKYEMRGKFLREAVHLPQLLVQDLWILMEATFRQLLRKPLPAGIVAVRFKPGGNDPTSRARRALAVTYPTLTPNSLVFGILCEKEIFFFHTLIPQPLPSLLVRLGAEPESER